MEYLGRDLKEMNKMGEQKTFDEIVSNPMWKPEKEGDSIEGEVIEFTKGLYSDRQPSIKAPSGDLFAIPSHTVLENKMTVIEVGDYVKITYLGEVEGKKGGNTYKDFKLERAKK